MSSKEVEVINHVDLELAEAAERERYHFKVTKRIRRLHRLHCVKHQLILLIPGALVASSRQ